MSIPARSRITGTTEFCTIPFQAKGTDTLLQHVDALRAAMRNVKATRPFHIRAIVILPDHLHMILTLPKGEEDSGGRLKDLVSCFAAATDHAHPQSRASGLDLDQMLHHPISSQSEKQVLTQYCWMNPVKHGLVTDPFDWPHSSIHRDAIRGIDLGLSSDASEFAFSRGKATIIPARGPHDAAPAVRA